MGRLFGTDGVRGRANADLTPELALSVARAAAGVLADRDGTARPVAVVGRDPRASGEMLEAAVVAGLTSAGAEVLRAGVLPTPALAHLTAATDADLGVMISASHNPMPDNGIKLFSRGGHKLPDALEAAIERTVDGGDSADHRPTGAGIGRVRDLPDAAEDYVAHLLSTLDRPLTGLTVVVDGAHGAASATSPPRSTAGPGPRCTRSAASPTAGTSTTASAPRTSAPLIEAVRAHGADLGLAHDGDADRCLAVTADGEVVDGDAILAICALALHERGALKDDTVVATVMSNLGFHHTMRDAGHRACTRPPSATATCWRPCGPRGPQPRRRAERPPGLPRPRDHRRRAADRSRPDVPDGGDRAPRWPSWRPSCRRLPQILINVPVRDRIAVSESDEVADAVNAVEAELGDTGRVLLRPSGTEQLVRVMVEAPTQEQADAVAAPPRRGRRRTSGETRATPPAGSGVPA